MTSERCDEVGSGWRRDLDGGGPVGVHLPVLVVVTLELELQVGPGDRLGSDWARVLERLGRAGPVLLPHNERLVDGLPQLEDVVADGQVVLQPERLQNHAVSHREGQTEVVAWVTWKQEGSTVRHFL